MTRSGLRASLAFLFLLAASAVASAEAPAADIAALIDRLTEAGDWDYIGGSPTDGRSFQPLERRYCLADGEPFRQPPDPPDPVRALVRQGAAAVPFLVAHLDDRRATKAAVPGNIGFDDRCDFNARTAKEDPNLPVPVGPGLSVRRPGRQHVVTVGDLCFAALGPIVNRRFSVTVPMPGAWAPLTSPTESPALREAVKKEWAGLTPERHRDSLIDDFLRPDSDWRRIGACEALACYYPDALEPLALKFLAQPTYNPAEVARFVHDELYAAAGARERRAAFDAYGARRGEAYGDGVLLRLYDDLQRLEQHEQHSAPLTEFAEQPRQCLIELCGRGKDVRSADRPQAGHAVGIRRGRVDRIRPYLRPECEDRRGGAGPAGVDRRRRLPGRRLHEAAGGPRLRRGHRPVLLPPHAAGRGPPGQGRSSVGAGPGGLDAAARRGGPPRRRRGATAAGREGGRERGGEGRPDGAAPGGRVRRRGSRPGAARRQGRPESEGRGRTDAGAAGGAGGPGGRGVASGGARLRAAGRAVGRRPRADRRGGGAAEKGPETNRGEERPRRDGAAPGGGAGPSEDGGGAAGGGDGRERAGQGRLDAAALRRARRP